MWKSRTETEDSLSDEDRKPIDAGWQWGWLSVWLGLACAVAGYAYEWVGLFAFGMLAMLAGTKMISDSRRK